MTAEQTSAHPGAIGSWRFPILFALFAIELIVLCVAHFPGSLTLDQFAFCDNGANLTLNHLVAAGLRPAVDFGFNYGLLSVALSRIWYVVFGATPFSYQAMVLVANLAIAWAAASIANSVQLRGVGMAMLFAALGFATQATYPAAAQAFEAAILGLALAQQSAGRYDRALALSAAAVFIKPSMGFFYGLLLLIVMFAHRPPNGARVRAFVRSVVPAVGTIIVLATILGVMDSPVALARTILPLSASITYAKLHFGFLHGSGHDFWLAPGMPWFFYLLDVSGFWICATLFLFAAAVVTVVAVWRKGWSRQKEMILTCALLHLIFLTLLFGNRWSWFYYSYVLVFGVAIATDLGPLFRRVGFVLIILAAFAWLGRAHLLHSLWRAWQPDSSTAGLWAAPNEREEWQRVREMAKGNDAVVLDTKGAAEILFPEFSPPVTLYLDPGWILSTDIDRKVRQLATAQMVILPYGIDLEVCRGIPDAPEIRDVLLQFEPAYQGRYFDVLRRRGVAAAR